MTWYADNLDKNRHCFLGKTGGVSKGKYAGLNVNTRSLDERNLIDQNLQIVAKKVGLTKENLVLLRQGVSNKAVIVDGPSCDEIEADGIVTAEKNVVLCIRTADCAPVLFEDKKNGVIGAAHAGWRGAFKGIMENVIKLMVEKGANVENICAAVGPCILQKSYEVDFNFYNQFIEDDAENKKYFVLGERDGHFLFDLQDYCFDRLQKFGIKNIQVSNIDTYTSEDEYFSFRRFTHKGLFEKQKDFPTHISLITL